MAGSPPGLTLVGHPSFRPFRNLWLLEELGVEYSLEPTIPRSEEAYRCNPFGKIPSLKHGDFVMYESAAINTYLADTFREGVLLTPPTGTRERGRYEQLMALMMSELDAQSLWIHRKHDALPKMFPQTFTAIPEAVKAAKDHFDDVIDVLAKELLSSGGDYLMGKEFSAADIFLVHCMNWAHTIQWSGKWLDDAGSDEMKRLAAYWELCKSRPAYKKCKEVVSKL
eukprot:TRINITY_DN65287_c0_g1_i1.p1 TRINITY_DN65287_c0_g1~~TRINITY_DN65287_c0_g1_i1.p1  ORF type:complete len:225 (-),score=48.35 TRINITY_DN65287_c0_g1_i1:297-971(-)